MTERQQLEMGLKVAANTLRSALENSEDLRDMKDQARIAANRILEACEERPSDVSQPLFCRGCMKRCITAGQCDTTGEFCSTMCREGYNRRHGYKPNREQILAKIREAQG